VAPAIYKNEKSGFLSPQFEQVLLDENLGSAAIISQLNF